MASNPQTPVVVPANAGIIDSLQAAGRYAVFLVGVVTALLGLFKARDFGGLIAYLQTNAGQILAAVMGLIGIATAAYGVIKTHKRGSQLVVAAEAAPNSVAKVVG